MRQHNQHTDQPARRHCDARAGQGRARQDWLVILRRRCGVQSAARSSSPRRRLRPRRLRSGAATSSASLALRAPAAQALAPASSCASLATGRCPPSPGSSPTSRAGQRRHPRAFALGFFVVRPEGPRAPSSTEHSAGTSINRRPTDQIIHHSYNHQKEDSDTCMSARSPPSIIFLWSAISGRTSLQ